MISRFNAVRRGPWSLHAMVALFFASMLLVSDPASALGGSGGHGGRLHLKGGGPNGFHDGGLGRSTQDSGSGFGYNGGIYGQGVYAPYGNTRCLRRIDGFGGPDVVRVC